MEKIVEIQRKSKTGVWTSSLERKLDGYNWFKLENGDVVRCSLDDLIPPSGKFWSSNWKFSLDPIKKDSISESEEINPSPEGWAESNRFSIKCMNGQIIRYPPIQNRPLRRRTWIRKYEDIAVQLESEQIPEENTFAEEHEGKQLLFVEETRHEEIEMNEEILKQRQDEILQLGIDVKDVHETMKELGQLVKEQGENLTQAEQSVDKTKQSSKKALEELKKAEKMQKDSNCALF